MKLMRCLVWRAVGYWIADASQLNDRFGTSDDLKNLSAELHKRGM